MKKEKKFLKNLALFFISFALLTLFPSSVFAQNIDPQYIFVRMICIPSYCPFVYNMAKPNYDNLSSITIDDIFNKVGTRGNNNNTRKVGIGVLIHYLGSDFTTLKQSLKNLLIYSKTHTLPVFIALDGFQWWDARPDLWNWWDSNSAGYNPDNKNNVEWTCWDSSCTTKKSWRYWVGESTQKPHPNLASRTFIEANKQALSELLPMIADWYNNELTPDKKWLFGGIALGVDVDMGGNYYYYPNGVSTGRGPQDSIQLGYAAVKTAGIRSSGQITTEDINEVIRRYLNELDKSALDLGIPRSKIFNHVGGSDLLSRSSNLVYQTAEAAINTYGNPGWSFYGEVTENPQNFSGLSSSLNKINNTEWASPEWLTFKDTYSGWVEALRDTLNYRNNRFLNIANWGEWMEEKKYPLDAIRTVANEIPSCWVTIPYMENVSVSDNIVTLQWQKGTSNDAVYLNVSMEGEFTDSGTLKVINTVNEAVTNRNTYTIRNLGISKYYWSLVAEGCSNQRKVIGGSFQITVVPTIGITPSPTPNISCLCNTDGACTAACTFNKFESPVSYHTPMRCSLSESLFASPPSPEDKTSWCRATNRTKGDSDGNGTLNSIDYFYYITAANGGSIPATVNPDFNGDGEVGAIDREILVKSLNP